MSDLHIDRDFGPAEGATVDAFLPGSPRRPAVAVTRPAHRVATAPLAQIVPSVPIPIVPRSGFDSGPALSGSLGLSGTAGPKSVRLAPGGEGRPPSRTPSRTSAPRPLRHQQRHDPGSSLEDSEFDRTCGSRSSPGTNESIANPRRVIAAHSVDHSPSMPRDARPASARNSREAASERRASGQAARGVSP